MINKKCLKFLSKFNSQIMSKYIEDTKTLTDILNNANSPIIHEIIYNAIHYYSPNVFMELREFTSDDEQCINFLKQIGYKINIKKEVNKTGEFYYIKICIK